MKNRRRITESELNKLVKRIVNEEQWDVNNGKPSSFEEPSMEEMLTKIEKLADKMRGRFSSSEKAFYEKDMDKMIENVKESKQYLYHILNIVKTLKNK